MLLVLLNNEHNLNFHLFFTDNKFNNIKVLLGRLHDPLAKRGTSLRKLIFMRIFSVTLLPIIACVSIIVRGYFIEILFAFMVIQWLFIVIMNFIYLKKLF